MNRRKKFNTLHVLLLAVRDMGGEYKSVFDHVQPLVKGDFANIASYDAEVETHLLKDLVGMVYGSQSAPFILVMTPRKTALYWRDTETDRMNGLFLSITKTGEPMGYHRWILTVPATPTDEWEYTEDA